MDAVWIRVIAAAVIAYFCGCFNGAVIVSKYILRDDVRTHGSGNAGLTNFYRTFGGPLTFMVILTDVLKAVVALLIGRWLLVGHLPALAMLMNAPEQAYSDYWCGLFCLLGHMFPCMFQFKGGKGILSGGTIIITKYVSLGSCWAGASFPFATWFVYQNLLLTILAVIIGGLILWKHRSNIARLISGTESKFSFHRKAAG